MNLLSKKPAVKFIINDTLKTIAIGEDYTPYKSKLPKLEYDEEIYPLLHKLFKKEETKKKKSDCDDFTERRSRKNNKYII